MSTHCVWLQELDYFPELVFEGTEAEAEAEAERLQGQHHDYVERDDLMIWVAPGEES